MQHQYYLVTLGFRCCQMTSSRTGPKYSKASCHINCDYEGLMLSNVLLWRSGPRPCKNNAIIAELTLNGISCSAIVPLIDCKSKLKDSVDGLSRGGTADRSLLAIGKLVRPDATIDDICCATCAHGIQGYCENNPLVESAIPIS
eukprot:Platyproteum_vivax@DN7635_c0_g1_i1.p1